MNEELKALETMGLVLPSPAYLAGSLLFGIVGYIAFRRGRKTTQPVLVWTGVALMLYPYAASETWLLWGIGLILTAWVYLKWN